MKKDEYMDRESAGLGLSLAAAVARRPMAPPLPMDSVRRGGDRPPTIAAEGATTRFGERDVTEVRTACLIEVMIGLAPALFSPGELPLKIARAFQDGCPIITCGGE